MMFTYFLIALLVYTTNVIPFFMPATWTVLTFIAIRYQTNLFALAIIGATFATLGRLTLAKISQTVLRGKILKGKTRENIDEIRKHLDKKAGLTFALILFYAFSPLASNQLFIAYGMTKMRLRLIGIPFFIGRLVSYTAFTFTSTELSKRFFPYSGAQMLSIYFILIQFASIGFLYLFTKLDWHELLTNKKLKFIKTK